ncbi:maleylacetate reductase [uncultured Tateyamaria sp.]|uniref:maleylacetate reductase n=1 Tax=uncultured Tateyamaria sp. TaxID=455651 RepID=UPI002628708C|nr:maleylacetate reductase [uncultured Tateyamaria sp.]
MTVDTFPAPTSARVLFGAGLRHTARDEVRRLGCRRALILSTPAQSDSALALAEVLGDDAAGVFSGAAMHTPVPISEAAVAHMREVAADCVVAIGGGSTTGLGKAIAYRTGFPQIVIPTTYAGSEATPTLGQTEGGVKTTLSDPRVQPEVILYDPELITSLPVGMTVTSALNAIAHAAEALYAPNRTATSDALALEGMRAFARSLEVVIAAPDGVAAREDTLRGAYACGAVLGLVGMSLHHKLCHTLGGAFDLPHADTHAIMLPHAIGYNARTVPDLLAPICEIFGGETPGTALYDYATRLNAPKALRKLGVAEVQLDHAAHLATRKPYPNPAPITRDGIRTLLQAAWEGARPQV